MGFSQVFDVNVVADAGAVRGGVVGSVDLERPDFPCDSHQNPRDQVGFRIVILADPPVGRAAAGVEIAEAGGAEPPGVVAILENTLHHELAVTVRIDGVLRVGFINGDPHRCAIGGAGGGEDENFALVLLHDLEQGDGLGRVVPVIFQRICNRFTDVGEGREMHHG